MRRLLWLSALIVLLALVDVSDGSSRGKGGKGLKKNTATLNLKLKHKIEGIVKEPASDLTSIFKHSSKRSPFRARVTKVTPMKLSAKQRQILDQMVADYEHGKVLKRYFEDTQNSWIDTMNTEEHRKRLMDTMLGSPDIYINHWFINMAEPRGVMNDMLIAFQHHELNDPSTYPKAFTVATSSSVTYAHYVGFIFFPATRTLHYFDPGRGIYAGGDAVRQRVLSVLAHMIDDVSVVDDTVDTPSGSETHMPMQCSGDSFCQTWTMFYIFSYFRGTPPSDTEPPGSWGFLEHWRRYNCRQRECLIRGFIVSVLDPNNYDGGADNVVFADIDQYVNGQYRNYYHHQASESDPWQILRHGWGFRDEAHIQPLPNGEYMACKATNYV